MRMVLSDDERELARLARDLLTAECPPSVVRRLREPDGDRMPTSLWKPLVATGLLGLPIAEDRGGSGGRLTDVGVLAVEAGRALCPTVVHSTLLLGVAVDLLGSDRQRDDVLPRLVSGDLCGSAALASPYDSADLTPPLVLDAGRVRGVADFVPDADLAELLMLTARSEGRTVGLLVRTDDRRVHVERRAVMGSDRYSRVTLRDVAVDPDDVVDGRDGAGLEEEKLRRVVNIGLTILSLDLVGVGLAALDHTVAHTLSREQFGRPIASFQAAQHLVADIHIAVHAARLAGHAAMSRLGDGHVATRETAVARMQAATAAKRATLDAHQLHGGMGYVLETDLHLWSERARVLSTMGGGADEAAEWLAASGVPA